MHWRRYVGTPLYLCSLSGINVAKVFCMSFGAAALQQCEFIISAVAASQGPATSRAGHAAMPASQLTQQLQAEVSQPSYMWLR